LCAGLALCFAFRAYLSTALATASPCASLQMWPRVVQIALALAHLHELQPDAPHGRLSSRTVFVTSANSVCVGRALSAASLGAGEPAPLLKRQATGHESGSQHSRDSRSGGPHSAPSPPPAGELLRMVRHSDPGCLAPGAGAPRGHLALTEVVAMSRSRRDTDGTLRLSAESDMSCRSSAGLASVFASGAFQPTPPGARRAAAQLARSESAHESLHGQSADLASISSAELPLLGRVTKICMPGKSKSMSQRNRSQYDSAEAAVWSRTGAALADALFKCRL
jgi:hypothetical protein